MKLFLVRMDSTDLAVAAPTMHDAIDAAVARVLEENADEENVDREWALSLVEQVQCLEADAIIVVDRKSWTLVGDEGLELENWRPMP